MTQIAEKEQKLFEVACSVNHSLSNESVDESYLGLTRSLPECIYSWKYVQNETELQAFFDDTKWRR